MLFFSFLIAILSLIIFDAAIPQLNVVPYPSSVTASTGAAQLDPKHFSFKLGECHADCEVITGAFDRYSKWIFMPPGSTGSTYRLSIFENRINATTPQGPAGQLSHLNVIITTKVTYAAIPK